MRGRRYTRISMIMVVAAVTGCATATPAASGGTEAAPSLEAPQAPVATTPTRVASTGGETPPLAGYWTRYWAPQGRAGGARYLLLDDGRFAWRADPTATDAGAQRKHGRWRREGEQLVLEIPPTADTAAGAGAEQATAGQTLRLQLGSCPDNAEARRVDPDYVCTSFDGEAYFRRPVASAPMADFF